MNISVNTWLYMYIHINARTFQVLNPPCLQHRIREVIRVHAQRQPPPPALPLQIRQPAQHRGQQRAQVRLARARRADDPHHHPPVVGGGGHEPAEPEAERGEEVGDGGGGGWEVEEDGLPVHDQVQRWWGLGGMGVVGVSVSAPEQRRDLVRERGGVGVGQAGELAVGWIDTGWVGWLVSVD